MKNEPVRSSLQEITFGVVPVELRFSGLLKGGGIVNRMGFCDENVVANCRK